MKKSCRENLKKSFNLNNGREVAESYAPQLISNLKSLIKYPDKMKQIVRIQGFVNSTKGFTNQPKSMNTVSILFIRMFGERSKHSRIAAIINTLPIISYNT